MLGFFNELYKDNEGQATTEYILIISVSVGMLVVVINKLIKPAYARLVASASNAIEKKFFGSDFHKFNIGRR